MMGEGASKVRRAGTAHQRQRTLRKAASQYLHGMEASLYIS